MHVFDQTNGLARAAEDEDRERQGDDRRSSGSVLAGGAAMDAARSIF